VSQLARRGGNMFKTLWAKGLGLVAATAVGMLIGGVALAGLGGHSALAQTGLARQTTNATTTAGSGKTGTAVLASATTFVADSSVPATLKDRIIDMMKDHMGLTDQQAGDWADAMTEHMQLVHGDLTAPMLDQMDLHMDQYGYGNGSGMMGGVNSGTPGTPGSMMNGATPGATSGSMMGGTYGQSPSGVTPGTMMGQTTPAATGGTSQLPGTMMGGVNSGTPGTPGSMMSGVAPGVTPGTMMGGTTTTTLTGSGTTTPTTLTTQTTAAPQTNRTPGTMMNGVTPGVTSPGTMMGGGGMMGGTTRTR
jgi:hypothetical protein